MPPALNGSMRSSFRELAAYRASCNLADAIHVAVSSWDKLDQWTIGTQVLRSSDSIGANIAEAFGRDTTADRRRILYFARGSLLETEHWLSCAARRTLAIPDDAEVRLTEIARTLNGLIKRPGARS